MRIEAARDERHVLEVAAVVARRHESDLLRLGGDVRGALHVAHGSRLAPHHGVVGEDVEARHQVAGGDGGAGRRLRTYLSGSGRAARLRVRRRRGWQRARARPTWQRACANHVDVTALAGSVDGRESRDVGASETRRDARHLRYAPSHPMLRPGDAGIFTSRRLRRPPPPSPCASRRSPFTPATRVDPTTGAVTPPIHLSTTFEREPDGELPRRLRLHSHVESEPRALEKALATLEGGDAAIAFSLGLGGDASPFPGARAGRSRARPDDAYYGTLRQRARSSARGGSSADVVRHDRPRRRASARSGRGRASSGSRRHRTPSSASSTSPRSPSSRTRSAPAA